MEFKKIYLEITNTCNLKCSFCPQNNREKKFLTLDEFAILLSKLKGYTKYLYFHVMGEPLLHPEINKMIDKASQNFFVEITTNGYFIEKLKNQSGIRELNISLHSYDATKIELDTYMKKILEVADTLENTYISYRLWVKNKESKKIIKYLENFYGVEIGSKEHVTLRKNVYFDIEKEFIWPSLENSYYNDKGSCMGCRQHIGILIDGSVVPCCLDNNGSILLGNIYKEDLESILNKDRFKKMRQGFLDNKKVEEFCKHCSFYEQRRNNL